MNWKSIGTTFKFGLSDLEKQFDHVDEDRGFFCGTHNYVEFYVVDVESDGPDKRLEPLGSFTASRAGEYLRVMTRGFTLLFDDLPETSEVEVWFLRGKVQPPSPYFSVPPYAPLGDFESIRRRLDHRCGCPEYIKIPNHPSSVYYSGSGGYDGEILAQKMNQTFEGALNETRSCPLSEDCEWTDQSVWDTIMHLNDTHKWSRERVADWLEYIDCNPEFPMPKETQ